ncbi:thioredoxin reductase-like selenoprotein T homolog CG3887 [Bacillus rossius redtenbacheri]|uniref:thioredoxin reductase-like selenoprotein T homolog CG3887 n=1 Tax=Bacillus rossius redtenbacheri TaxID=93214 RepID=UPI002FDDCEE4
MADTSKIVYLVIFFVFSFLTLKDLFPSDADTSTKEIPETKVGLGKFLGPTIKFRYCYSCGYQKAFQEYTTIINQKYPEVIVEGENYNPPGYNTYLAKLVGVFKMAFIACILCGVNVFQRAGLNVQSWWPWLAENKIYACMMTFFLCNLLEGNLVTTGAFEISFNDMPVWSKLETGRIPQPTELFQIMDSHLQFRGKEDLKPGFAK